MQTSSSRRMAFQRPKDARNKVSHKDSAHQRTKRAQKRREKAQWKLAYQHGEIYNALTIKHTAK